MGGGKEDSVVLLQVQLPPLLFKVLFVVWVGPDPTSVVEPPE